MRVRKNEGNQIFPKWETMAAILNCHAIARHHTRLLTLVV
jgi:hypothetical protein